MIVKSKFRPLWWLRSPHLQSLWPVITRGKIRHDKHHNNHHGRKERFILSDGDFLDLNWFDNSGSLILVLHGLEGSIDSPYAIAITEALKQQGYQVLFMHFRGCSGTTNTLPRSYHSGETGDLHEVISHAEKITGKPIQAAIGYSLGGNVLLKYLGETGQLSSIQHAIAVSVPYVLSDAAKRMASGISRIYQSYLLNKLHQNYHRKKQQFDLPIDVNPETLNDFASFDDQVTAPLHGFSSGEEYYRLSSSRQFLKNIAVPTLLIHAKDDPFMFESTVPEETDLSPKVTLELSDNGGHVGFITGSLKPKRWLEGRIIDFLRDKQL